MEENKVYFEELKGALEEMKGNPEKYGLDEAIRDAVLEFVVVDKNNGIKKEGVVLKFGSGVIFPNRYFNRDFLEMDPHDAVRALYFEQREAAGACSEEVKGYGDWNYVREHVLFRLVNAKLNEGRLESFPHREWMDLVIQYYLPVTVTNGWGSITVLHSHAKNWGVTEEDLYAAAMKNSAVKNKAVITPLRDALMGQMKEMAKQMGIPEELAASFLPPVDGDDSVFVSNEDKIWAAGVFLNPGVVEQLEKLYNGSFVLFPSSTHEVICKGMNGIKGLGDLEGFIGMSAVVNGAMLDAQEVLSDNVYYYDAEAKTFRYLKDVVEMGKIKMA